MQKLKCGPFGNPCVLNDKTATAQCICSYPAHKFLEKQEICSEGNSSNSVSNLKFPNEVKIAITGKFAL